MWIEVRGKISKAGRIVMDCVNGPIIELSKALDRTGYSQEKIRSSIERLLRKSYLRKVFIVVECGVLNCYRKVLPWEVIKTDDVKKRSRRETFKDVFRYMIRQKVYSVNGVACSIFNGGVIVLFSDNDIEVDGVSANDILAANNAIAGFFRSKTWLKENV